MASQPFNTGKRHKAPRDPDTAIGEFWLENPFRFEHEKGFNLSMFERNRLYMNRPAGAFVETSYVSGIDLESDTRGVAVGDLDEDGKPDVVIRNVGGGPVRVFRNEVGGRNTVSVRLRGTVSNKHGVGARIWLTGGRGTQYREHFPQNSLNAQSALESIFGVGTEQGPFDLRIVWPSGTEQTLKLAPGRHIVEEPNK